jgi:putative FmdB family regulatory protein
VPLYEYQCVKCHRKTEKIESVSGPHLKKCPHCGSKVERLQSAPAIQFKGSGWYVTDYAGKKTASLGDSSSAEKSDAKEAASEAATKAAKESGKEAPKESAKETPAKETKEKKPAKK